MKLTIHETLVAEARRYLGYSDDSTVDSKTHDDLIKAFETLIAVAQPKYTYHLCDKFTTKAPSQLHIDRFKVQSLALYNHMAPYEHAVVLAATLGSAVDRLIDQQVLLSPSNGLLLNAAASALIEDVCDFAEREALDALVERFHLESREQLQTCFRFSPGYGDLDLSVNGALISTLEAEKRIGLTQSKNHLLLPRKSVTAIFGVSTAPQKHTESATPSNKGCKRGNCTTCTLKDNCPYRRFT